LSCVSYILISLLHRLVAPIVIIVVWWYLSINVQ
jgi:hypothetical protein